MMLVMSGKELGKAGSMMLKEIEQAYTSSHHSSRARGLPFSYSTHLYCLSRYLCVEFHSPFAIKWFTGLDSMMR